MSINVLINSIKAPIESQCMRVNQIVRKANKEAVLSFDKLKQNPFNRPNAEHVFSPRVVFKTVCSSFINVTTRAKKACRDVHHDIQKTSHYTPIIGSFYL